jgi:histidyl-tRNA synthetase
MYTIPSGEEGSMALRPEGTPPVLRAYLEHGLHKQEPFLKLYYIGPMFRHERPQRGRLRQFHQIGAEMVGSLSPLADAETILLAADIFQAVGLKKFRLWINSMGCRQCRPPLRSRLRQMLSARIEDLCPDCRDRLERNVFRIYDCKNERCGALTEGLPVMAENLCAACAEHYGQVKAALGRAGLEFAEDPRLVRGLDYYTRTVYEFKHPDLGARDAIGGGGRYDDLVELLGGPSVPCVGFALGAEPTLLAMEGELGPAPETALRTAAYVVRFEDDALPACFDLVRTLRQAGIAADMDYEDRSPKAQMRVAGRLGAAVCLLLGRQELERGEVTIRDMAAGRQWSVPRQEAVTELLALGVRGTRQGA